MNGPQPLPPPERGVADSLAEGWARLARTVSGVTPAELQRLQDAYYVGASVVFDLVQLRVAATNTEDEAIALLEGYRTELQQYAALQRRRLLVTRACRQAVDQRGRPS